MKHILSPLIVIALAFAVPASAAVPPCVLGGPTAMNPHRQLDGGEVFTTTERPLVVNLRFRPTEENPETVGECRLPSGKKVAIDEKTGILLWVADCGNDEVNRNIVVDFARYRRSLLGATGPQGPRGKVGPRGPRGPAGQDFIPPRRWCARSGWHTTACVVGGAVVLGAGAKLLSGGNPGPGGVTGGNQ